MVFPLQNNTLLRGHTRLANPLDEIIESTIVGNFGVVAAIDDFSSSGELTYVPMLLT